MGLGKTLTMIALVATDLDNESPDNDTSGALHPKVPTTLIVVPPSCKSTLLYRYNEIELIFPSDRYLGGAAFRVCVDTPSEY